MEWMAGAFAHGRYHHCPDGSHLAIYDDQKELLRGADPFPSGRRSGAF